MLQQPDPEVAALPLGWVQCLVWPLVEFLVVFHSRVQVNIKNNQCIERIEALFLDRDIYNFILFLVGGGAAFGSTTPTSGAIQAIAAGLVPTGLTPVAFFPPSPTQQLQALSVIFLEAPLKKRKKRFAEKGSFRFYRMHVNTYPYGSNFLQTFIQVLNI